MNILIVEDEETILDGMCRMIRGFRGNDRVFAALTAKEAEQCIREHRPEIIITDIVLPDSTGLDLMHRMRVDGYSPKIIVVSSHSNFAYAQKSIQLGAADYLLKPVRAEEIRDKIQALADAIHAETDRALVLNDQAQLASLGKQTLKDRFLLGLCTNQTSLQQHVLHRLAMWELQWLAERPFVVVSLNKPVGDQRDEQQVQLDSFAIGNIAMEIAASYSHTALFGNTRHDWIVVTAHPEAETMIKSIYDAVKRYQKFVPAVGVSRKTEAFQYVSRAYTESQHALNRAYVDADQRIVYYSEGTTDSGAGERAGLPEEVAARLWDHDAAAVSKTVRRYLAGLANFEAGSDIAVYARACFEWLLTVHAALREWTGHDLNHLIMGLWGKLDECFTIQRVEEQVLEHLSELSELLHKQRNEKGNIHVEKAKAIIQERFNQEDFTMQSVADCLHIHPVTLSKVFKKETGRTFIDYVIDVRVETAKRLLEESPMRIYEISSFVGYRNLQHFGKIFKKRTGTTPKEYKQIR